MIFSQPESPERRAEVQADIRYQQQIYRNLVRQPDQHRESVIRRPRPLIGRTDWSESLATSAFNFTTAVTYPAKYSFNALNTTPDCANDYIVFTLPTGAAAQANIVAFNNLYVDNSGTGACPGTAPGVLFAYNASRGAGSLNPSPSLSRDGTGIAFIEGSAPAQFHVLKWKAGNVPATFGAPWNRSILPDCASNGAVAPCEYSVVYSTSAATISSPYVDYGTDTAYVTDDAGLVAAISPVFGGGAPKVTFSLTVPGTTTMTPPVYDSNSGNVFVADAKGFLYYIRTNAGSSGSCASGNPPCLGATTLTASNGTPISDAPLVDSSNNLVFVFTNSVPGGSNSGVVQTDTTLSAQNVAFAGPAGANPVHAGAFNNAYYSNPVNGLLYVCGTNANNIPQLYAISFAATGMNTGAKVTRLLRMNSGPAAFGPLALAFGSTACSPLAEVFNQSAGKDYMLLGVNTNCYGSSSFTGCAQEFDVTNGFPAAALGTAPEGGLTGIVIDNVSNGTNGNASQTNFYFATTRAWGCSEYTGGTTSAGNCLVKLTQTGLQ